MTTKRKVKVFTLGCPAYTDVVELVNSIGCPSCEVTVLDMNDATNAQRAKAISVKTAPAIAVNGKLLDCCAARPTEDALRAAGLGVAQ